MSLFANDDERVLMTAAGYDQLGRELDNLRTVERRRLAELLRHARGDGALDDNPALVELLDEQAQLEQRIARLQAQLAAAEVPPPPRDGRAGIGSVVRVREDVSGEVLEYELVGPLESDATNGRVSTEAPVGRALIGQPRGADVAVHTPRGAVSLRVLHVAPSRLAARRLNAVSV